MNRVISEIQADIDWRISEIATIKSITVDLSLSEHKKAAARKYSIPAFYAVWESFVVKSFETYIIFLNSLELSFTNINSHILTHNSCLLYTSAKACAQFVKAHFPLDGYPGGKVKPSPVWEPAFCGIIPKVQLFPFPGASGKLQPCLLYTSNFAH